VFNAISTIFQLSIAVVSFIGEENRSKPLTGRKSLTNFIAYCCIEYTLTWSWVGIELAN